MIAFGAITAPADGRIGVRIVRTFHLFKAYARAISAKTARPVVCVRTHCLVVISMPTRITMHRPVVRMNIKPIRIHVNALPASLVSTAKTPFNYVDPMHVSITVYAPTATISVSHALARAATPVIAVS